MNIYNLKTISQILNMPNDESDLLKWIRQSDVISFFEKEICDTDVIIYASLPFTFIHTVLIPLLDLDEKVIEDLLNWSTNPYSCWGLVVSSDEVWIENPLEGSGSKTMEDGEQILFIRSFDGDKSRKRYFEIEQKISHVLGLHFMYERNAWCRLDSNGDLLDVIKIIELKGLHDDETGTIVTMNKEILGEYTSAANLLFCRMFDITRYKKGSFNGWKGTNKSDRIGNSLDIFIDLVVYEGYGSYSRGIQINNISIPKQDIINSIWDRPSLKEEKKYATFIAFDWKNKVIAEVSCDPSSLSNYFTKSGLPFELTPAFFKSEVLLKYKSDREKYQLEERSVSCRGTWGLKSFDINDAGQIHAYLGYLNKLPYQEQLHWKQYNEKPKAPLSKRAYAVDFEGRWFDEPNPLSGIKQKLRSIQNKNLGWWKLRDEELLGKVQYPFTTSCDEWEDEILNLDQLVVEGFEEKWLRQYLKSLGKNPDIKARSLKLIEDCLIEFGFEDDHAKQLMSPFHEIHNLRSKFKGHSNGDEAKRIRKEVLANFGSYRNQFINLSSNCNDSLEIIIEAFRKG